MPQNQLIGIVLLVMAVVDTAIGHLFVAPRVADKSKRNVLRIAFSVSGALLGGLGFALYMGLVQF